MANRRDRIRTGTTGSRAQKAQRQPGTRPAAGPGTQQAAPPPEAGAPSKLAANRATRDLARTNREAERKRTQRRRTLIRGGVIGAAAAGLIALIVLVAYPGEDIGVGQRYEGTGHIPDGTPLTVTNRPPSSGAHYAGRAPYGLSTTPLDPGNWIHVLEHGGMVVLYKCGDQADCEAKGLELRTAVFDPAKPGKFGDRKVTITPYQDMEAPYTAVAWGRILPLQTLDAAAMLAFYNRYLDRGPENAA